MKLCSIENCWGEVRSKGFCNAHYLQYYKQLPDYQKSEKDYKTKHPLYHFWTERKANNSLCAEWLDFWTFVKGVGDRPKGNFLLVRITKEPFGPDNFKWMEHLKRKEDETRQEWWARKWATRQLQNPGMERSRHFKRKYGITTEEYNALSVKQNHKCFICEEAETAVAGNSGIKRKLAVDHDHDTKKVRSLLCWRCNGTIGKVKESIELLQKMIDYLKAHKL